MLINYSLVFHSLFINHNSSLFIKQSSFILTYSSFIIKFLIIKYSLLILVYLLFIVHSYTYVLFSSFILFHSLFIIHSHSFIIHHLYFILLIFIISFSSNEVNVNLIYIKPPPGWDNPFISTTYSIKYGSIEFYKLLRKWLLERNWVLPQTLTFY